MAKFFKISVFFLLFSCILTAGSAQNVPGNEPEADIFCNAPAPDSFRITAIGNDWVSLAWTPIGPDATHRIIIALQVDSTVFTPIDTLPSVSGDSITLTDFEPGRYRISISTNCKEGGTGDEDSFLNPTFGLIIDLVIGGRTPTDPIVIPEGEEFSYASYNWVGFEVNRITEFGRFNYFEFKEGTYEGLAAALIKRDQDFTGIMAADFLGIYPRNPSPLDVPTGEVFQIINTISGAIVGQVEINANFSTKKISIKRATSTYWNHKYIFKVLVAQSASNFISSSERASTPIFTGDSGINKFSTNTLFNDEIVIFPLNPLSTECSLEIEIVDISGRVWHKQSIQSQRLPIKIQSSHFKQGIYLIKIKTPERTTFYKAIKPN